eukprot:1496699-Rhodomonas_salina.1
MSLVLFGVCRSRRPAFLPIRYAMSGTDMAYGGGRPYTPPGLRPLSAYARAMRCPVLTQSMVRSTYAHAMQCPGLT